jgi:hypothetical protein
MPTNAALRAARMPPTRSGNIAPPLRIVIQRHRMLWRSEHQRTRNQLVGRSPRKIFCTWFSLSNSFISGCLHKPRIFCVRNIRLIHPEPVHIDPVDRARIRHRLAATLGKHARVLAAHGKFTTGNPNHSCPSLLRSWHRILYGGSEALVRHRVRL